MKIYSKDKKRVFQEKLVSQRNQQTNETRRDPPLGVYVCDERTSLSSDHAARHIVQAAGPLSQAGLKQLGASWIDSVSMACNDDCRIHRPFFVSIKDCIVGSDIVAVSLL